MTFSQTAGILYGLALGDALGYPTEFLSLSEIRAKYGDSGIQEPPDPALYSDDTQMTLALLKGVLDAGLDESTDTQMQLIGREFVGWLHSPDNNRAPGQTCIQGVRNFEGGTAWRKSGIESSKGCGAAMRVAPIGYLLQYDAPRLKELATASSLITHRHPAAVASAVAGAYLVKLALDGVPVQAYPRKVMAFCDGLSDEFDQAILRIGHVLAWNSEERALKHLGEGWAGEEAIALALYCVMRYPDDYVKAVQRAAHTNGDSDTIACIVGGIMGARLGVDCIPDSWRNRCENKSLLDELAHSMAKGRTKYNENL